MEKLATVAFTPPCAGGSEKRSRHLHGEAQDAHRSEHAQVRKPSHFVAPSLCDGFESLRKLPSITLHEDALLLQYIKFIVRLSRHFEGVRNSVVQWGIPHTMKHRNHRITLSTLRARAIYEAVTQFTQQHPLPRSRGRKPIYSEALILTLALLRTARRLSYRQLLFCVAPEVLPEEPLPALGTLLYRLQTIPDERWHALLHGLAAQGIAREVAGVSFDVPVVLVDGTGVGFDTPFCAQFREGSEIRRIRLHLKAVVLVYCRGGGGLRWVERMRTRVVC